MIYTSFKMLRIVCWKPEFEAAEKAVIRQWFSSRHVIAAIDRHATTDGSGVFCAVHAEAI
jgi:hypothetical protein